MNTFRQTATRFYGAQDGNFAVVTAFGMTMLALAVGFGVNIVQAYQVKMSLRDAMDAAVTSTARDLTTGIISEKEAKPLVQAFLNSNGDTRFITQAAFTLDSLVIDRTAKTVEGTASANVDLLFPLFSVKDPKVSVTSAAVYSDKRVEIAMMLDVTGSMQANYWQKTDKIGDLRKAAANAVKLAMQQNADPKDPRVRIALVPYSDAVNVGALAEDVVFVEEKDGPDLPPPIDAPVAASVSEADDNCATERKLKNGAADFSDDGPDQPRLDNKGRTYLAKVNRDDRLTRYDNITYCPEARLVPLTANADQLLGSIEKYKAGGVTAGAIGIQWTYYMLSAKWRTAIKNAGLGAGPAAANSKKVAKVAILMTDGLFNTAFSGVKSYEPVRVGETAGKKSRSYAESLCANMQTDGIEVFTIGFDLDNPDIKASERKQAKTVLKNCSTPDYSKVKHYFEASTGEELDAAFREIIGNTERLALTK